MQKYVFFLFFTLLSQLFHIVFTAVGIQCTQQRQKKENYLVDKDFSATNMGTYNYFGPAQPSNHTYFDVLPWALWGNTEETEEVTEEITEEPEEEDFWSFWSSLFNFEALIQAFM